MRADKVMELARLHGVYVAGAFNWRTTPTSLPWMLRLREAHMAEADPNLNPNACGADGYTSDDLAELGETDLPELCEANGCSEGLCTDAEFQAQVQAQAQAHADGRTEWADSIACTGLRISAIHSTRRSLDLHRARVFPTPQVLPAGKKGAFEWALAPPRHGVDMSKNEDDVLEESDMGWTYPEMRMIY